MTTTTEADDRPMIILAEDDDDFRRLVSSTLRADGYLVYEASNGSTFDRLIKALVQSGNEPRPALLVSDIRMPGLSGLEVIAMLRQLDRYTPVVFMTGFSGPEVRIAQGLGAAAVFSKPFDLDDLRMTVTSLIRGA